MGIFDLFRRRPASQPDPAPAQLRADGWQNVNTGLGVSGRDSRVAAVFCDRDKLTAVELEPLYRFSWLAAEIVETVPEHMTRAWGKFTVLDSPEDGAKLDATAAKLCLRTAVRTVKVWAQLYGGAIGLVGVDDGQTTDQALAPDRVRSVRYVHPVDRNYLHVEAWDSDPDSSNFGKPLLYRVQSSHRQQRADGTLWHYSRVIRFDGTKVPQRIADSQDGWGDSVLERVYSSLRDHNASLAGAASCAQEFALSVLGIKNLAADLSMPGADAALAERLQQFMIQLRAAGVAVIDADQETFTRMGHTTTGLPDILDRLADEVSGAAGIPRAILYGQARGTTRAGADSDTEAFFTGIADQQQSELVPQVEAVGRMLAAALGIDPELVSWKPEPLRELDQEALAKIHDLKVKAAAAALGTQAVSATEIRPVLLVSGGYTEDSDFTEALEPRDPSEFGE